jgi:putative ABC transport system permease protein
MSFRRELEIAVRSLGRSKGMFTTVVLTLALGTRSATVVGVLEPSVPYPAETELIANIVTSPHHLPATMKTGREHRMTELFGRLAPGADLERARAELQTAHAAIVTTYPKRIPRKRTFG